VYTVADEGPPHAKTFTAAVSLADVVRGTGTGRTKKAAEQEAAEAAWRAISAEGPTPPGGE
jgi:ribonuclease-3